MGSGPTCLTWRTNARYTIRVYAIETIAIIASPSDFSPGNGATPPPPPPPPPPGLGWAAAASATIFCAILYCSDVVTISQMT